MQHWGSHNSKNIQNKLEMKKILFQKYKENISGIEGVELIKKDSKNLNNNWLINIRFKKKIKMRLYWQGKIYCKKHILRASS